MVAMKIQHFDDINQSHAATGYRGRTDLPIFHIFTIEDTYPDTCPVMLPYTFNFYQVVLLENSADAALSMNTQPVGELTDTLTFASPDHVLSWIRGEAQRGFILYFKEEFLVHHPARVEIEFPFFRLNESNLLRVEGADKSLLLAHFTALLTMFHSSHPYRVQMLQSLLLLLLFDCKRLYQAELRSLQLIAPKNLLVHRFQQSVNQHFLTRHTVEAYANLLAISPDHLSKTVKAVTGKTAYAIITERILLEAKKLLAYTDFTIAEIAHYLGFAEPTHFGRFFRQHVKVTPLVWRHNHTAT